MAFEGKECIITHHAGAVIRNADQLAAAAFHLDADTCRSSIEGVLEQLLDHRGRSVNHLACGDLVRYQVGKNADTSHGSTLPHACRWETVFCLRPDLAHLEASDLQTFTGSGNSTVSELGIVGT